MDRILGVVLFIWSTGIIIGIITFLVSLLCKDNTKEKLETVGGFLVLGGIYLMAAVAVIGGLLILFLESLHLLGVF